MTAGLPEPGSVDLRATGIDWAYAVTLSLMALGQLLCWACFYYAFSSFVIPMQREMGWSKPSLMGAFTVGLAVWGACSYLAGAAIDRGFGRAVLAGGALLGAGGMVCWSRAQDVAGLQASWALIGAAMAMTLYEPAFSALTKRYPARYGRAITFLALVGGMASTLSFPASEWLIDRLGWRDALLAMAGVLAVVVAPMQACALRGAPDGPAARAPDAVADGFTVGEALRERAFWLLTANMTLSAFAAAALWAHIVPALASKGLGTSQVLTVVMLAGPAQVAGRLLHFAFARVLPARAVGLAVMAGLPLSFLLLALGESHWVLMLFAVLFGFANGLVTVVRGTLVPAFFGRGHLGRISGAMTGIALLTRASAPLATALLLSRLPGYRELLLALCGVSVAALAAFALAAPPGRRSGAWRDPHFPPSPKASNASFSSTRNP